MPLEPHNPRRVLSPPMFYYSIKAASEKRRKGKTADNFQSLTLVFLGLSDSPIQPLFLLLMARSMSLFASRSLMVSLFSYSLLPFPSPISTFAKGPLK